MSKSYHPNGAHLLPKLRCQVAEFLNDGYLERLRILTSPTCVGLRYGHVFGSLRSFSWRHGINQFTRLSLSSHPSEYDAPDLPRASSYRCKPGRPTPGWSILPRPSIAQTLHTWCRNINLLSITYAFRPQLRSRLTLSGLPFPRNLRFSANRFFTCFVATHVSIRTSTTSTAPSGTASTACGTLPYRCANTSRGFGSMLKPR